MVFLLKKGLLLVACSICCPKIDSHFLVVIGALYWRAPNLVSQEHFRTGSGYLRWVFPYWRCFWFYITFAFNISSWNSIHINLMSLLKLLPDNFKDWWEFSSLRFVSRSSGMKTCHFQFKFPPAAWATSFESFWLAFLDLILSFQSSVPGRRSIGCPGSIVAFLCGVVCFPTCLTGWINSFWLSFSSVTVFVIAVVILVRIVLWDRVFGAIVFV